jgi:glycosyltransferase involved in cell wall biosynthesis
MRDGVDGFLVEVGDVAALVDRLAELARDPELRTRMGAGSSARSVERYAVSRLVDDIDVLYRSLLAGEGEPSPASALEH